MQYQNAVTDRLVVILRGSTSSLLICSKSGRPKLFLPECEREQEHEFSALLSSSIFAETTVVLCNGAFTLCPSDLPKEEQHAQLRQVSGKQGTIDSGPFTEGITQVFFLPEERPTWWDFLVNPQFTTDLAMEHRYKAGGRNNNTIFFSVLDDQLAIRIYSGDRLILANRYPAASSDEVFYFVLFAVEQLKLDMNSTHVEFIGSDERYAIYQELFRNYLPLLLHLPLLDEDVEGLGNKEEYREDWFARLCLQCVS